MWAIEQTRKLPKPVLRQYARAIIDESTEHGIDPFTLVAIIDNESKFNPAAVDPAGVSVGWGQYRLDRLPECKRDLTHAVCQQKKAELSNWRKALAQIAADITAIRKYCKKATGRSPLLQHWLAMYQGAGSRTRVCGMKKVKGRWVDLPRRPVTKKVMEYREWLSKNWNKRP